MAFFPFLPQAALNNLMAWCNLHLVTNLFPGVRTLAFSGPFFETAPCLRRLHGSFSCFLRSLLTSSSQHHRDRVSLGRPGCPGTHSVEQAGLELRDKPASASRVRGLQVCASPTLDFSVHSPH